MGDRERGLFAETREARSAAGKGEEGLAVRLLSPVPPTLRSQVLGKREFRQLLAWRLKMAEAWKKANPQEVTPAPLCLVGYEKRGAEEDGGGSQRLALWFRLPRKRRAWRRGARRRGRGRRRRCSSWSRCRHEG